MKKSHYTARPQPTKRPRHLDAEQLATVTGGTIVRPGDGDPTATR
jgi:hypothetical protein